MASELPLIPAPMTLRETEYPFLWNDDSVDAVADRYGTTVAKVWEKNKGKAHFAKAAFTEQTFCAFVEFTKALTRAEYEDPRISNLTLSLDQYVKRWRFDASGSLQPRYNRKWLTELPAHQRLARDLGYTSYEDYAAAWRKAREVTIAFSEYERDRAWLMLVSDKKVHVDVLLARANADRRRGREKELTEQSIQELLYNWPLRVALNPLHGARDGNLAPLTPAQIPYPRLYMSPVKVSPTDPSDYVQDAKATATTEDVPEWVSRLYYDHLSPILRATQELKEANEKCRENKKQGVQVAAHIATLDHLLRHMEGGLSAEASAFRAKLLVLQTEAAKYLGYDPDGIAKSSHFKTRVAVSEELTTRLNDAVFFDYAKRALTNPELTLTVASWVIGKWTSEAERVSLWSLCFWISWQALVELIEARISPWAYQAIEESFNAIGNGAPLKANGLLKMWFSTIGSAGSVVTTSVGNLPGPPSVAVVVCAHRVERAMANVRKDGVTWHNEQKAILTKLGYARAAEGVPDRDWNDLLDAFKSRDVKAQQAAAKRFGKSVGDAHHKTPFLNSLSAALNVLGFFAALEGAQWSEQDDWLDHVTNGDLASLASVTGAGMNAAIGAVTVLQSKSGWVAKVNAEVGLCEGLGAVVGVVGVAAASLNYLNVFTKVMAGTASLQDRAFAVTDLGASILILCAGPLPFIGLGISLITTIIKVWPSVKRAVVDTFTDAENRRAVRELFENHLAFLGEHPLVRMVKYTSQASALKAALDDALAAVKAPADDPADYKFFRALSKTDADTIKILNAMNYSDAAKKLLTNSRTSV
jgi:hypothetical protein